jgi:hypothetical protein
LLYEHLKPNDTPEASARKFARALNVHVLPTHETVEREFTRLTRYGEMDVYLRKHVLISFGRQRSGPVPYRVVRHFLESFKRGPKASKRFEDFMDEEHRIIMAKIRDECAKYVEETPYSTVFDNMDSLLRYKIRNYSAALASHCHLGLARMFYDQERNKHAQMALNVLTIPFNKELKETPTSVLPNDVASKIFRYAFLE